MNSSPMEALDHVIIPIKTNDEDTITKIDHQDNIRKRRRHSCFEWTQLIATICIPIIIAVYTIVDNNSNQSIAAHNRRKDIEIANISRKSELEIAQANRLNEIEIAEQSRQKDRDLATDHQLENILVEYQTFLAKLIIDNGITLSKSPEAKVVGHFKTFTALKQLDTRRKSILIRSLYDAKLITLKKTAKSDDRSVLDLRQLDLRDIRLGSSHYSSDRYSPYQYIELYYLWLPQSTLTNASFRHTRLECATFSFAHMDSVDLSFAASQVMPKCFDTLRNTSTDFTKASLVNATLYHAALWNADFSLADLTLANMQVFCQQCIFWRTILFKADLSFSMFEPFQYDTLRLDFRAVNLKQAVAHSTQFRTINFDESDWSNVQASKAIITDCTFANATMNNCSFVKSTIRQSIFQTASLYSIDLSGAVLHNVTFINSDMRNANLSYIKCDYCVFINVILEGAVFKSASLRHSNFRNCRIDVSQLEEAIDLSGLTLSNRTVEVPLGTAEQHLNKITYNIRIKTGDQFQAGTDADVHLKIFGEKNSTDQIRLMSADHTSDQFEKGQIDEFTYEFDDLGKIESILIGHNEKNPEAGWFLDWVEIDIPMRSELYRFACHRWLDKNKDDGQIELKLIPSEVINKTIIPYEITVITGDKLGAGTDANVFLTIYGENEDSGEHKLLESKTNRNSFEQNQEDVFQIKALSLGKLRKIRIRHDDSGGPLLSAWYLDRIEIHDSETDQIYHFICQKWLATDEDDKMISREIPAIESRGNRSGAPFENISESSLDYGLEMQKLTTTYKVSVITSDKWGSGTNANVYIIIFSEHNNTGKVSLTTSKTYQDPFESGHTDVFEFEAMSIGEPTKIKIGHDNLAFLSDWLLEQVQIYILKFGQTWIFTCGKWLNEPKDGYQLEVELFPNIHGH